MCTYNGGSAKMTHIPNGLMCFGCTKALDKCNHLEFNKMPIIDKKDKEYPIVKCTQHIKKEKS